MNLIEKIENEIKEILIAGVNKAKANDELSISEIPAFIIEVPKDRSHGDYATNIAMLLTKEAKQPPRKIAEAIINNLETENTVVAKVEIAGPGFINFTLVKSWVYDIVPQVLAEDRSYGRSNVGQGKKVQVEFVSANPTGLLHMGNARGAALGDSIASLLDAAGFYVEREYYINDAGNQVEKFGTSLEARLFQVLGQDVAFPEDGYHGVDIIDTIKKYLAENGNNLEELSSEERKAILVKYALEEKLSAIKNALADFGVEYDVWYRESSLYQSGKITEVIETLRAKDLIYEKDGALWLKTTLFGDEKDEVVVRANGLPTYFAADIAYHLDKFDRGFEWLINIWGADHHGHVSRMKGAMNALGHSPEKLDIILMQLVRLFSGGEMMRMSKRTGQFITLNELVEEVGKDAARYFFVMRSADSHLDFDMDLAKSESSDNPVFYVQYAHARISSILRQAKEAGFETDHNAPCDLKLLQEESEFALLRKIAEFPSLVAHAALNLEPYRLTRYAHDLASLFHTFYNQCRVLHEERGVALARIKLIQTAQITLRNLLNLLGISAPEKM